MKKMMNALVFLTLCGGAFAEVNCVATGEEEFVAVNVRDTFLERKAFVKQVYPDSSSTIVNEVGVRTKDKARIVSFTNEEMDFSLHIDKRVQERSQNQVYRGVLSFGDILTELNCFID